MTVVEIAKALGISHYRVGRKVKSMFPMLVKNGVKTNLTEAQFKRLKEALGE